MSLTR
jgi:hypothetical protein